MKTFITIPYYLKALLLCASFTLLSCDTEIPEVDNESPNFLFRITGDGFDQTFDQDTDFDSFQLNLREDSDYDFILSAGDAGGTKQIQWQYAHDYIEFEGQIPSPWTVTTTSPLSTVINWSGNPSDPVTGMILAGTFRTNGDLISHQFSFTVQDYGGTSSMENTIYLSLNIFSGDHATEIVNF